MKKGPKLFHILLISIIFSYFHLAQNNPAKPKTDAEKRGMEIVFVVDVSFSMQWDIKDIKGSRGCVTDFVYEVYQELNKPDEPGKPGNNFHLITFSDYATYHQGIKEFRDFRDKIKEENDEALKKSQGRTYPKNGLWEVFDLIEENFIEKVGVVVLICDGEDNRNLDEHTFENDMRMSIKALKNIGFSVFPVFVNTGDKRYMRRHNMEKLRQLSGTCANLFEIGKNERGKENYDFIQIARNLKNDIVNNTRFNSPKLYTQSKIDEQKLNEKIEENEILKGEVEVAKSESDEKFLQLKGNKLAGRTRFLVLKFLNKGLVLENKLYKVDNERLLRWIISMAILFVLLAIAAFLGIRSYVKGLEEKYQKAPPPPTALDNINEKTSEPLSTENLEKPTLDKLWGRLVDRDTKKEYNLIDKKNGYTPGCIPGDKIEFYVKNRAGNKVILVQQEEGSIEFLDEERNPCKNNCGYISKDTRFFNIENFGDPKNNIKRFEYHFLNKLKETFDKPLLDKQVSRENIKEIEKIKKNFIGRQDILEAIRKNFITAEVHHHYLICGVSNTGKTSLLRYMHNIFFPNDPEFNRKYISILFEFNEKDYKDKEFNQLKNDIKEELDSVDPGDKRTRLILIDEYDKIFVKYGVEFGEFLLEIRKEDVENVETGSKNFFIFAGQRGKKLLNPRYKNYLPQHTEPFVLKGLDELKIILSKKDKINSIKHIDNLLADIGFPQAYFPPEVKKRIIKLSSGFPFFTKAILHRLLIKWLGDYHLNPLTEDDVDKVVLPVIHKGKKYTTERAFKNYDKEFNKDLDNTKQVTIESIIINLTKQIGETGKVGRKKFERIMTGHSAPKKEKKEIISKRKENFDKKIDQLIDMGLIVGKGNYLFPIPYMFFTGTGGAESDKATGEDPE